MRPKILWNNADCHLWELRVHLRLMLTCVWNCFSLTTDEVDTDDLSKIIDLFSNYKIYKDGKLTGYYKIILNACCNNRRAIKE